MSRRISKLEIDVIQLKVSQNYKRNLKKVKKYLSKASGDICCLPEAFLAPFGADYPLNFKETKKLLRNLSFNYSGILIAGSVREKRDKSYNTCFVLKNGEILTKYRKRHLFDVKVNEDEITESSRYSPGDKNIVFTYKGIKIGLAICYDLRFPNQFRDLARLGAKLIIVPAAFNYYTGKTYWDLLIRARAIDAQCFILAAAQAFQLGTYPTYGHSMLVSPEGKIIKRVGKKEGLYHFKVNFKGLNKLRESLPILNYD